MGEPLAPEDRALHARARRGASRGAPGEALRDAQAFAVVWLVHVLLAVRFAFVTDDAYISFRYARNWALGNGLRYNLGEPPVEGFSNFLWVALAACVERAGAEPARVLPWVSTLAGSLVLWLVFRALRGPLALPRAVAFLAALALACCTPFAVWCTGGLETMSFALFLFAAFERLVLARAQTSEENGAQATVENGAQASARIGGDASAARDAGSSDSAWHSSHGGPATVASAHRPLGLALGLQGGVLLLLAALSRPEGIYWGALIVAVAAAARRARCEPCARALLAACAVLALGFALFSAWRVETFGAFLQNSATAKLAAGVRPDRLARGLRYVALAHLTTLSLLAIPLGALAGLARPRRALGAAVLVLTLAFPAWAVVVSGDFMAFARFLVPGLPFGALAWGWLLEDVRRALGRGACTAAGLALAALSALPGWDVHLVPAELRRALDFRAQLDGFPSEFQYWQRQGIETRRWVQRGRALAQIAGPGDSIVLSAIGAIGYHSRLFVFDRVGLVTRAVALLPPPDDVSGRMPGHDQSVAPEWFLERGYRPTFLRMNFHTVAARAELAQKVRVSRRNLAGLGLEGEYVLDVFEVVDASTGNPGVEGDLRYFFVWRAIPAGVPPAEPWSDFERRIDAHLAGGTLARVAVELAPGDAEPEAE